jgi:hypothetical protein
MLENVRARTRKAEAEQKEEEEIQGCTRQETIEIYAA